MKERIKRYWKKLLNILKKPEMRILPSTIAFHIILAIIPLLTIVVLIASFFGISIDLVTKLVSNIMPTQVSDIIVNVISGKGFDQSVGIFNIVAFFLASNGTYAVINTSNTLYKIKNRSAWKARLSSVALLLIIILLFLFLLLVPVFGGSIIRLMSRADIMPNFEKEALMIYNVMKWPISILIIYFNIKLIYAVAPSKNIKGEETTYGAMFTTVCWILSTIIFRFYLGHFARYDILYGNLSSIIIMMVWMYFLSYIFVFGMAINVSRKEEQELIEEQMREEEERLEKERKKQERLKKKKEKESNKN